METGWKPQSSVCFVCATCARYYYAHARATIRGIFERKLRGEILKAHSTLERNYAHLIETNVIAIGHLTMTALLYQHRSDHMHACMQ